MATVVVAICMSLSTHNYLAISDRVPRLKLSQNMGLLCVCRLIAPFHVCSPRAADRDQEEEEDEDNSAVYLKYPQ